MTSMDNIGQVSPMEYALEFWIYSKGLWPQKKPWAIIHGLLYPFISKMGTMVIKNCDSPF